MNLLQETFEEWYGKEGEEQEAFFRFVDSFSNDRNDQAVMDLVLKVYEFSRQHPDRMIGSTGFQEVMKYVMTCRWMS